MPSQLWVDCRIYIGPLPTSVCRIVVDGCVFSTGAPVCCRFAAHPRSYDFPFPILLSQCVVNIILTTIGSCGERISRRDGSSRQQFTPSCNCGSGAHPLQWRRSGLTEVYYTQSHYMLISNNLRQSCDSRGMLFCDSLLLKNKNAMDNVG